MFGAVLELSAIGVLLVEDILKQPFRFSCTDSLAEQPIRVISLSDCLWPTHGRFNMLTVRDTLNCLTKTADLGLVCQGL